MTDYSYYCDKIESAKESQERAITGIASGSAVAAMVPVPGLDIAVDISAIIAFAHVCLGKFGLTEEALKEAEQHIAAHAVKKVGAKAAKMGGKAAVHAGKKVMEKAIVKEFVDKAIDLAKKKVYVFLERGGIRGLVRKYAAKKAGSSAAKYVPLVGTAIAGGMAFYSTQSALREILEEMYATAKAIYLE